MVSYVSGSSTTHPSTNENGNADCDMNKRKVVWTINNLKGG